jgi:hypothetical protein
MTRAMAPKVGDWVEVLSFDEIRATLDGEGEREQVPFMPEMAGYSGRRLRVSAVMTKICGGGRGMRGILGEPLVLLDDLRCDGRSHGLCHRGCTLLWKPAWFRHVDEGPRDPSGVLPAPPASWPYPTRTESGAYRCQATALPRATFPVSIPGKLLTAFRDLRRREWNLGSLATVYVETLAHRLKSLARRAAGVASRRRKTPVERLGLRPGDWVQVKSLAEISATLDRNGRNRGLEFSRYMTPFCGRTYRVGALMENFIDERTGELRRLENTVLLESVWCGGETTSGPCRRAELLYWREIWLRPVAGPGEARGVPTKVD